MNDCCFSLAAGHSPHTIYSKYMYFWPTFSNDRDRDEGDIGYRSQSESLDCFLIKECLESQHKTGD